MSSFVKKQLKTAREALAAENYEYAETTCADILENDSTNYNALVFRGLALLQLGRTDESLASYNAAISAAPSQALAYQGLVKLQQETKDQNGILSTLGSLQNIYLESKDAAKCLDCIQQQLDIHMEKNNQLEAICCLKSMLPGSPLAELSPAALPSAIEIWQRILELQNSHDSQTIAREVEARRMRLGSDPLSVIKATVEREVVLSSEIDTILKSLLSIDTDLKRISEYNCKLLGTLAIKLAYADPSEKSEIQTEMDSIANTLVNDQCTSPLAFETLLEAENTKLDHRNEKLITLASTLTDDSAISLSCKAYLLRKHGEDLDLALQYLMKSLEQAPNSVFTHHLLIYVFLDKRNWKQAISICENCEILISKYFKSTGRKLDGVELDINLMLGTAYVELGKRSATLALTAFRSVLEIDHSNLDALIGLGVTLATIGKYNEAIRCFDKIITIDATNQRAHIESGWTLFLQGEYPRALDRLIEAQSFGKSYLIKYRLAKTYWMIDDKYRTDKAYVHSLLIEAARLNPDYAPTFTLLGMYYKEVESDIIRATKCFLKAISIDNEEDGAIKALVFLWLENDNVHQAVALLKEAAVNLPRLCWIWKQLGIISLSQGNTNDAVGQFQTALRLDAKDRVSWVSLGEAYASQGKYMAALKALDRALELEPQVQFPKYLKALVYHKLGMFPEAISNFRTALTELENSPSFSSTDQTAAATTEMKHVLVPTLKGLGEALLYSARTLYDSGAYGACASHLFDAIEVCLKSFLIAPRLLCTAKILGDACLTLATLVPGLVSDSHSQVIDQLITSIPDIDKDTYSGCDMPFELKETDTTSIQRVFIGAAWAYYRAMLIARNNQQPADVIAVYAHDLSIVYFRSYKHAVVNQNSEQSSRLLKLAIKYVQVAICMNPQKDLYWNALGVYSSSIDPKLCQHALIKAVEVNMTNPRVWCNLGYFYMFMDDMDLAGQCFSKAQFVDPDWPLAWFGQAYLAKLAGSREVYELMNHAHELGNASHFDILYSYGLECFRSSALTPSTLIIASHCLLKCVERFPEEPAAYNLYGLILERQHQHENSTSAFSEAIRLLSKSKHADQNHIQKLLALVLENKARCESAAGRFHDANTTYKELANLDQPASVFTFVGQGFAAYFVQDLKTSLMSFEKALELCDSNSSDDATANRLKNDTILLLSQVLYALDTDEHIELAKQQLFQCISNNAQYVPAIIGLCVMGLVRQDWVLAQTAAAELIKLDLEVAETLDADIDWVLCSFFIMLNGQTKTARGFLSKTVHRYPWKAARWSKLAELIYCHSPAQSDVSAKLAASGLEIFISSGLDSLNPVKTTDVSDMQRTRGLALLSEGNPKMHQKSRTTLCQAIRSSPSNPANWLALGLNQCADAVSNSVTSIESAEPKTNDDLKVVDSIAESAITVIDTCADSSEILSWSHLLKAEALLQSTLRLTELSEIEQVIQKADAVINTSITSAVKRAGYVLLGRALLCNGDTTNAERALKTALQYDDEYCILPLEELAAFYAANSNPSATEFCYRQAIAVLSDNTKSKTPTLLRLVQHFICVNDHTNALESINMALVADSAKIISRFFQTLILIQTKQSKGKLAKNLTILSESDEIDPVIVNWLALKIDV
ncbi:Superkiller protein 3 [Batrachochytrium dendrobatidis]